MDFISTDFYKQAFQTFSLTGGNTEAGNQIIIDFRLPGFQPERYYPVSLYTCNWTKIQTLLDTGAFIMKTLLDISYLPGAGRGKNYNNTTPSELTVLKNITSGGVVLDLLHSR